MRCYRGWRGHRGSGNASLTDATLRSLSTGAWELRAALPEAPALRRKRLKESGGFSDLEFEDVYNSGLLVEVENTVAGEGTPAQVVESRGFKVVSDDTALIAAIDETLAAQPDVLEKIRDGKVQAAAAVIGAVMRTRKSTADAVRVRELLLLERGRSSGTASDSSVYRFSAGATDLASAMTCAPFGGFDSLTI